LTNCHSGPILDVPEPKLKKSVSITFDKVWQSFCLFLEHNNYIADPTRDPKFWILGENFLVHV
jgi:uncharacterized membrane protein